MLWECAYSGLYFSDLMWPDFDAGEVDASLIEFSRRQRRFGLVPTDGDEEPLPDESGS